MWELLVNIDSTQFFNIYFLIATQLEWLLSLFLNWVGKIINAATIVWSYGDKGSVETATVATQLIVL